MYVTHLQHMETFLGRLLASLLEISRPLFRLVLQWLRKQRLPWPSRKEGRSLKITEPLNTNPQGLQASVLSI